MVRVKVKTVWQGKVAVRDRYVAECREKEQDLVIDHNGGSMRIPWHKIDKKTDGVSREIHRDRYGKTTGGHRLVYFLWKPTVEQGKMDFEGVAAAD